MIPINDTQPNRYGSLPLVTISLIALNTVILIWEYTLPEEGLQVMFSVFGFTPALVWAREGAGMISAMTGTFLHGGFFHLFGNMIFLWVFGRRVEDACGPLRFLVYYLFAGACANLVTALVQAKEAIPTIGASGAIFGVMGAYLILFPGGRIRILWFVYLVPVWPKIRAVWVLLYYLAIQIPPAFNSYLNGVSYSTAYWAHLGGFAACIFIVLFMRPESFARFMTGTDV